MLPGHPGRVRISQRISARIGHFPDIRAYLCSADLAGYALGSVTQPRQGMGIIRLQRSHLGIDNH